MTYWVDDARLLGASPFLFVHDSIMLYQPAPNLAQWTGGRASVKVREAAAALDEIMCRGMQPVVPGILVQTEAARP